MMSAPGREGRRGGVLHRRRQRQAQAIAAGAAALGRHEPSPCREMLDEIVQAGVRVDPDDPEGTRRGKALYSRALRAVQDGAPDTECLAILMSVAAHARRRRDDGLLPEKAQARFHQLVNFLQNYERQER